MRAEPCWTIVPIVIKPDALDDTAPFVSGAIAQDFGIYLAHGLDRLKTPDYEPRVAASRGGAALARQHVLGDLTAAPWYTLAVRDLLGCQHALRKLANEWAEKERVAVVDLIEQSCEALGFQRVCSVDLICSLDDYYTLYRDTGQPDMHPRMIEYFVGKRIRCILLCGDQENSALHILKAYLRRVMRYPTPESYNIQNWLHVTNPDASNFAELLRMFHSPGNCVAAGG